MDCGYREKFPETVKRNEGVEKELSDLKKTIAAPDTYGLAKVTSATDVTQESGIALSAVQNNATINGTLSNQILKINNLINSAGLGNVFFLGTVRDADSNLDTIAERMNIPAFRAYTLTQYPIADGNYVQNGASHVVLGMQYANNLMDFKSLLGQTE